MKTNQTYFGIEFTSDFPLDQTTCRRLAKLLYANPNTSPEEAIHILQNRDLCLTIDQLLESLQVEVEKVSLISLNSMMEPNIQKLLFDKAYLWIREFSCPTPREIAEVTSLYVGIPDPLLINYVEKIVKDENIPPQRIIDDLLKYSSLLSNEKTDSLLDLYNDKIAEVNSPFGLKK